MTDTVYIPSWPPTSARFFISTIFPAIRNRMPTGAYLRQENRRMEPFQKVIGKRLRRFLATNRSKYLVFINKLNLILSLIHLNT